MGPHSALSCQLTPCARLIGRCSIHEDRELRISRGAENCAVQAHKRCAAISHTSPACDSPAPPRHRIDRAHGRSRIQAESPIHQPMRILADGQTPLSHEIFGRVELPAMVEWADGVLSPAGPAGGRAGEKGNGDTTLVACAGRVAESLRAPANGDPVQVRAFFERTSARAVAAALAAKGDDASDWTAATPRDAKTP